MSDDASSSLSHAPDERQNPVGRLLGRLRGALRNGSDSSLRESLEDVIEQHDETAGEFSPEQRSMLQNLLGFGALRVEDVMVPRADIVAVEQNITIAELLDIFRKAGHSRLPVYRNVLDDPVGMVHIKDLVAWLTKPKPPKPPKPAKTAKAARRRAGQRSAMADGANASGRLRSGDLSRHLADVDLVREVLFVPPSMPAADLLVKMQSTRNHLAIVVDEYGGTDGLVSIEDLVEQIVGQIEDEHDVEGATLIEACEDGGFIADARAPIDELQGLLGVDLIDLDREEDVDTLGGLVFSLVGRVPVRGELIRHRSGIEFEVLEADPRRIRRLRVHLPRPASARAVRSAARSAGPEGGNR